MPLRRLMLFMTISENVSLLLSVGDACSLSKKKSGFKKKKKLGVRVRVRGVGGGFGGAN